MDRPGSTLPSLGGYSKPHESSSRGSDSEDGLEKEALLEHGKPPIWQTAPRSRPIPIYVHVLLLLGNIAACLLFYSWTINKYSHGPDVRFTPLRSLTQYESRIFELDEIYLPDHTTLNPEKPTRFNGPPSPELENAWDDLTQYQNIRMTDEEIGDRSSDAGLVKLPDGGYFGTLTVYHSLHCVRRLHHFMYKDHYYPNISDTDFYRLKAHADHCLDTLRQNIQCAADTTVQALHWGSFQRVPLSHDDNKHECVNWEMIDGWAKERSFSPMSPGYLNHPTFGPAYLNGVGDPLGLVTDEILQHP